jgi:hypothetical protein
MLTNALRPLNQATQVCQCKTRDVPFTARAHHPHLPEPTIVEVMLFFVVDLT